MSEAFSHPSRRRDYDRPNDDEHFRRKLPRSLAGGPAHSRVLAASLPARDRTGSLNGAASPRFFLDCCCDARDGPALLPADDDKKPVVKAVTESFATTPSQLTITGQSFGRTRPFVTLHDVPLSVISYTDTWWWRWFRCPSIPSQGPTRWCSPTTAVAAIRSRRLPRLRSPLEPSARKAHGTPRDSRVNRCDWQPRPRRPYGPSRTNRCTGCHRTCGPWWAARATGYCRTQGPKGNAGAPGPMGLTLPQGTPGPQGPAG